MITEFEFTLTSPIFVHESGEKVEKWGLTLKAPSNKQRKHCFDLKQTFTRVFTELAFNKDVGKKVNEKNKEDKEDNSGDGNEPDNSDMSDDETKGKKKKKELEASDILMFIASSKYSLNQCFDSFEKLLASGICYIENKQVMTSQILEKMSLDDLERLFGDYMNNFLVSSLMNNSGED